jgi:hypothetical protein
MTLLLATHKTRAKISRPEWTRFTVTSIDLGLNDAGFTARWVPAHQDRGFSNAPPYAYRLGGESLTGPRPAERRVEYGALLF